MEIKAYAKINLALDVVRRREDGYHELDMIMVPISLYDILKVEIADKDEIICAENKLKLDDSNTIYKAIRVLRAAYGINEHFKIELTKNIPIQAGLAGGSADGAAMIKVIDKLCSLDMSMDEMIRHGVKVGADVPFCLYCAPARVRGIGEKIEAVSFKKPMKFLLVKPKEGVSTKRCFESIDFNKCIHPDMDEITKRINAHENYLQLLDNTLEEPAKRITPVIEKIENELKQYDFDKVLMSGSGSSVFAVSADNELLKTAYKKMKYNYSYVDILEVV